MSQELIDALKRTKREQVDLSLGQVPLSPTIARAGRYNVVVAPTPGSNKYTQLASALSKVSPLLSEFGKYQQAQGQKEANQLTLEEVIQRVEAGDTDATGILEELGKQRAFSQNIYRRYSADKIVPAFRAVKTELQDLTPEQLIALGIKSPDDFERYAREKFAGVAEGFKEFVSTDRFMAQLHNDYIEGSVPVEASNLAQGYRKGVRKFNIEQGEITGENEFSTYNHEGTNGSYSGDFVAWMKEREGFEPVSKWDNKQFSVGHGTRATRKGVPITKKQADAALREELTEHYGHVTDIMEEFDGELALNNNQIQALTSLSFNAGPDNVRNLLTGSPDKGKGELRDLETIKKKWLLYTKSNKPSEKEGLKNRRIKELELFNTPIPEDRQEQEGEGAIVGKVSVTKQAQDKLHNLSKLYAADPDIGHGDAERILQNSFLGSVFSLHDDGRPEEAQELLDAAKEGELKFSYSEEARDLFVGNDGKAMLHSAQARLDALVAGDDDRNAKKAEKMREEAQAVLLAGFRARHQAGDDLALIEAEAKADALAEFNAARDIVGNNVKASLDYNASLDTINDFFGGVAKSLGNHIALSDAQKKQNHDNYGGVASRLQTGSTALEWKGFTDIVKSYPREITDKVFEEAGFDLNDLMGTSDPEARARAVLLWQNIRGQELAELERDFHAQAQAKLEELKAQGLTGDDLETAKAEWESGLIQQSDKEILDRFIGALQEDKFAEKLKQREQEKKRVGDAIKAQQEENSAPITAEGDLNLPTPEMTWQNSQRILENAQTYRRGTSRFGEALADKTPEELASFYTQHRDLQNRSFEGNYVTYERGRQAHEEPFWGIASWAFPEPVLRGRLVMEGALGRGTKPKHREAENDFITVVRSSGLTVKQVKSKMFWFSGKVAKPATSLTTLWLPSKIKVNYNLNLEEYFDLDNITTSKQFVYNIESLSDEKLLREIAGIYKLDFNEFSKNQKELGIQRGILNPSDN